MWCLMRHSFTHREKYGEIERLQAVEQHNMLAGGECEKSFWHTSTSKPAIWKFVNHSFTLPVHQFAVYLVYSDSFFSVYV
jgi:hypothetical protein